MGVVTCRLVDIPQYPSICARTFRLEIWEVPEDYVADFAGSSDVDSPIGKRPIGTYDNVSEEYTSCIWVHSHPVGSLGKRLDYQILILLSPFTHPRV